MARATEDISLWVQRIYMIENRDAQNLRCCFYRWRKAIVSISSCTNVWRTCERSSQSSELWASRDSCTSKKISSYPMYVGLPLSLFLPLLSLNINKLNSLSLSHTHTHTHTASFFLWLHYQQGSREVRSSVQLWCPRRRETYRWCKCGKRWGNNIWVLQCIYMMNLYTPTVPCW